MSHLNQTYFYVVIISLVLNGSVALKLYRDSDQSGDYSVEDYMTEQRKKVHTTLQSDINEFIDLIPSNEVRNTLQDFYKNDEDVEFVINYLNGNELWTSKKNLFEGREVRELERFFSNIGLNVKETWHRIDDVLGITKLRPQIKQSGAPLASAKEMGGLFSLTESILSALPQDDLFMLFFEKLDSSIAFSNLIENIGSHEFSNKFDSIKKCPELKKFLNELHKRKIDVKRIIELFQSFFVFGTF